MIYLVLILGMCGLLGCTSEPPVVETPVVIEEQKKEVKEEAKADTRFPDKQSKDSDPKWLRAKVEIAVRFGAQS